MTQVKSAVKQLKIAYAIVAIRNVRLSIINVTIKNMAKMIAATSIGHLKILCNAIEIIITAIGNAKKISSISFVIIAFSPF